MVAEAPSALIYGSDNFVAKKLGELLADRGIKVYWDDEEVGRPLYFFDFGGGEKRDGEMVEKRVKICLIDTKRKVDGDYRMVNLHDVYGVGIDLPSSGDYGEASWWFTRAVDLAARNKNLVLPKYGEKFRLLAVEDAVEAIMRAVIISGTTGKIYEITGGEIDSKEVASVLIDLAKMTRVEIRESTEHRAPSTEKEKEFEDSAKALRWKPVVTFREGVREMVAEAVARIDEEQRNEHRGPRRDDRAPSTEDRAPSTEHRAPRTEDRAPRTEHRGQSTEHRAPRREEEEILVEDDGIEDERVVGKKVDWKKIEPIKSYELKEEPRPSSSGDYDEPREVKKPEPVVKEHSNIGGGWWKKIAVGLGIFFVLVGLVIGYHIWGVVNVVMSLSKPVKLLEEQKIDEVKKMILKYKGRNDRVGGMWFGTKLGEIVKISDEVLTIELKLCDLAQGVDKINGAIFEEKVIDFKNELTLVSKRLMEIETQIGIVSARLDGVRKWMPGRWRPEVDRATEVISENTDLVTKMRQMTEILPEILGLDGKRREYLVLLQNEMELRATGGFIGSFGILSFQDGRLLSFDIKDVYEADGQLVGHVEPPEEIKRYLGEAKWFMRDSNWKVSFPEASKDIQWFFEKEVGRKVDGVIGVNLAVVKSMLEATGPILVPDFKEKVDKNNLYEQAEFYSESKFFPGSVQKASFLSGIGKQMFAEIANLKTVARWNLLMGLINMLETNDFQISLNNTVANLALADLGWNGEVFGGNCGKANCYSDYLYVVESNFGVNKANYFLYRSMEQKIDLKKDVVERTLRINYENMAKSISWPGGDYKNYLRIYLPKDVQVSEVSTTMDGQKKNIALNEVKMQNVYDKRELGFLVTVPILKKVVVEVKYDSKVVLSSDKFSYLLYNQRQPGFGDTGMINLVSMPEGYLPIQVTPSASVVGGKLLFNQKLDTDIKLGVEIAR